MQQLLEIDAQCKRRILEGSIFVKFAMKTINPIIFVGMRFKYLDVKYYSQKLLSYTRKTILYLMLDDIPSSF